MRDWLYWIWLAEAFGPGCDCRPVLEEYGEPRRFYEEGEYALNELCRRGVLKLSKSRREHVQKSFGEDALDDAKRLFESVYKLGLGLTAITDREYPSLLRRIDDPPVLLYVKGELPQLENVLTVGVVGSRRCCDTAAARTEKLCRELSETGAMVVSGLAQGIDTAAARAVTEAGYRTIAVVGCGLDIVYPMQNTNLFYRIAENGAVVSEYPPGSPPVAMHFPQRNRIISGISRAVVVAEAGLKSGALITAREAKKQKRGVFVLDCFEDSACRGDFQGCRMLLKQGAVKISCASEIFDRYGGVCPTGESWEDRYLAWDGVDEPDGFDEPEWIASRERRRAPENDADTDSREVSRPAGVRVMLPEDWPEAPGAAGDPKAKEFGRFLRNMRVERGMFGATVLTFEGYGKQEQAQQPEKTNEPDDSSGLSPAGKKQTARRTVTHTTEKPQEVDVTPPEAPQTTEELSELGRQVLAAMNELPQGMEELSGRLDIRIDKLAAALAELEIDGFVVSQPGARYMLTPKRRKQIK